MVIETKYNIGQEVWYVVDEKNKIYSKIKIKGIEVYKKITYYIVTFANWQWRMKECNLFPTKEELLKSL